MGRVCECAIMLWNKFASKPKPPQPAAKPAQLAQMSADGEAAAEPAQPAQMCANGEAAAEPAQPAQMSAGGEAAAEPAQLAQMSADGEAAAELAHPAQMWSQDQLWARWAAGPPIEPAAMPATAPTWQLWPASDESDSEEEHETVYLPAVDCGPFQPRVRQQAGPPIEQEDNLFRRPQR